MFLFIYKRSIQGERDVNTNNHWQRSGNYPSDCTTAWANKPIQKISTDIWSQVLTEIKNDNNNKKFKDAETKYNSGSKDFKGWNVQENEKYH